jgi:hypothetical protein
MSDLVQYASESGEPVLVEVDSDAFQLRRIARNADGVVVSGEKLDDALGRFTPVVQAMTRRLHEFAPEKYEIEFGVKLTAAAGAVVAKTAIEGHFTVKLAWERETRIRGRASEDAAVDGPVAEPGPAASTGPAEAAG